jgi:hypothetical protein
MITETTLNLYPIIRISGIFIVLGIAFFLFHNGYIFKSFSKHDSGLFDKFLSKYPNVSLDFINKGVKEQNIENNQEIHEINKRFDKNDKDIKEIKETLDKIIQVIEEMQNRG